MQIENPAIQCLTVSLIALIKNMSQNSFLYVCACKNQNAPVTNSGHTANQSILQFDWLIVMPDLAHSNIEPQFLLFSEICVQK